MSLRRFGASYGGVAAALGGFGPERPARWLLRFAGLAAAISLASCQTTPLVGPSVLITYHEVGACNPGGSANTQASAVFLIDRIANPSGSGETFYFAAQNL